MTDRLHGVVLAGGGSLRMGTDKAMIEYNGVPQWQFAHDLLEAFCTHVFISAKRSKGFPEKITIIEDRYGFQGPLNGLLTVFGLNPAVPLLVLAVDMPLVDRDLIAHLLTRRQVNRLATCFLDAGGKRPEPLLSVWEPASFPLLGSFVAQGKFSPREFLETHDVARVQAPDAGKLININTPAQLRDFYSLK